MNTKQKRKKTQKTALKVTKRRKTIPKSWLWIGAGCFLMLAAVFFVLLFHERKMMMQESAFPAADIKIGNTGCLLHIPSGTLSLKTPRYPSPGTEYLISAEAAFSEPPKFIDCEAEANTITAMFEGQVEMLDAGITPSAVIRVPAAGQPQAVFQWQIRFDHTVPETDEQFLLKAVVWDSEKKADSASQLFLTRSFPMESASILGISGKILTWMAIICANIGLIFGVAAVFRE